MPLTDEQRIERLQGRLRHAESVTRVKKAAFTQAAEAEDRIEEEIAKLTGAFRPTTEELRAYAHAEIAQEPDVEVDKDALVSRGDCEDGVFIQAWAWIEFNELK